VRLKICFKTGTRISEQPLITKPGMQSRPTDLDGFRRLRALKISDSEMRGNDRDSDGNDEREGNTPGEGLLYID
jgi:hypothetical protein